MTPPPFETILPEIKDRSRRHYSRCNVELRDERVQESLCQAWKLYDSAVRRGNYRFTPCTLTWYANRAVDEGRRLAGYTTTDALDRHRAISFDELDGDALDRVARMLADWQLPILEQVRVIIDYPPFLESLPEREREIVRMLAEGWKRCEIAARVGVTPARVTQILAGVADSFVATFGLPGFEYRARGEERSSEAQRLSRCRSAS